MMPIFIIPEGSKFLLRRISSIDVITRDRDYLGMIGNLDDSPGTIKGWIYHFGGGWKIPKVIPADRNDVLRSFQCTN